MSTRARFTFLVVPLFFFLAGCSQAEITASPTFPPVTPEATVTANPFGLQFVEILEQVSLHGKAFNPLNLYGFLRYRKFPAEEMTWTVSGSEHFALSIANGLIIANPIDAAWYGSETIQVEACEPTGACTSGNVIYSVMDRTAFSDVQVTYIINSGFLITAGDKKVLIDAIQNANPVSDATQDLLMNAEPPFDDIDLILATHSDTDHFNAAMVRQYLQNNPKAVFVSTTQAASQLSDLYDRVLAVDPVNGSPVTVDANGIQVEAIYLSHGYAADDPAIIYNNGYVVTIGAFKFFHTGDTADLRDVVQYNLADQSLDLAFVHYFYLQDDRSMSIVTNSIGARYLFPIHYLFTEPGFDVNIRTFYPDAVVFYGELGNWLMPLPED